MSSGGRDTQHSAPKPYKLFRERPLELGTGRAINGDPEENSFLDGMIDDVIIWNRALSKNEVAEACTRQPTRLFK